METLADDQRRCLSVIYEHFHEHAAWPLLATIQHQLFAADDEFPFVEVLETVSTSFQNSRPPDGEVWVTARGIRACAGREAPELADLMAFVDICRDRYKADPDAQVGSADLLARGWSPERIQKMYLLTQHEHDLWRGGGGLADGSWHWLVSHDIAKFRGITDIDAYLARRDELRRPHVPTPPLETTGQLERAVPSAPAVAPLDPVTLRELADLICGDSGPLYRSGIALTHFFKAAGIEGPGHDGSSRNWWARQRLEQLNANPAAIEKVILRLADPREYAGDPSKVRAAVDQLNRILAIEGLSVVLAGTKPRLERGAAALAPEPPPTGAPLPTVDFATVVQDPELAAVLDERWKEVGRCVSADASLAAVVLLGSILEGALLAIARANPAAAGRSARAPKDRQRRVRPLEDWSLAQLLEVAADCKWIHDASNQFAVVLRDYRNLIHPAEQVRRAVTVDADTAAICLRVAVKALNDLAAANKRGPQP